jgi:hypothetical protein
MPRFHPDVIVAIAPKCPRIGCESHPVRPNATRVMSLGATRCLAKGPTQRPPRIARAGAAAAARPATLLSPGEQARETSAVGARRPNAAPVRGTYERTRIAFGSSMPPVLAPTRRRLNLRRL